MLPTTISFLQKGHFTEATPPDTTNFEGVKKKSAHAKGNFAKAPDTLYGRYGRWENARRWLKVV